MKLLHMVTVEPGADADADHVRQRQLFLREPPNAARCAKQSACVVRCGPGFAWNHGDFQQQITRTWVAMVGPGVRQLGRYDAVFTDHADVRPTILALLGLKDDYVHDGRVLAEWMTTRTLCRTVSATAGKISSSLRKSIKQLNAPLGSDRPRQPDLANRSDHRQRASYARYLQHDRGHLQRRDELARWNHQKHPRQCCIPNQPVGEGAEDGLGHRASALIDRIKDLANQDRDDDDHHRHFGE